MSSPFGGVVHASPITFAPLASPGDRLNQTTMLTVTQRRSPYSESIEENLTTTKIINRKVPTMVQAVMEWEERPIGFPVPAPEPLMFQPMYVEEGVSFPLRKDEVPEPPPPPPPKERERAQRERAAPAEVEQFRLVEVPEEIIQVNEKRVPHPNPQVRIRLRI